MILMNIPRQPPTEDEIEKAAALASMEGGVIKGLGFEDAKKVVQDMNAQELKNFIRSTRERAQERI